MKAVTLSPRTKYWGFDYKKQQQLRMTGKEWRQYAKRETFKSEHGADAVWGGGCEIWLDGLDMDKKERRA